MLLVSFVVYGFLLSAMLAVRGFRAGPSAPAPTSVASVQPFRALRVLVVGSTGATGRQIVAEALRRGHEVTALARDPAGIGVPHPRLRVVRGDVLDAPSLDAACRGQEAVISALGHKRFFYPTRIQSEGTRNLLEAMERHDVKRLVCMTSLGLGDSAFRMGIVGTLFIVPVILPFYMFDKAMQERIVARSGAEWIIVRPGALTNGPQRGRCFRGPGVGEFIRGVRVSRADVADFMVSQLTDDSYLRSAPGICW